MNRQKRFTISIILTIVIMFINNLFSFGFDGHKIVGQIAVSYLSPTAEKAIQLYLTADKTTSLAEACIWADLVKKEPEYEFSQPLHYANIPKDGGQYNQGRDCPNNICLVEAIKEYQSILEDPESTQHKKIEALKFIVHFVGDIHQPLHLGLAEDRGGNDILVDFFGNETNLHGLWDYGILEQTGIPWERYADSLQGSITPKDILEWDILDPEVWANESFSLVHNYAYTIKNGDKITKNYVDSSRMIIDRRLKMAGVRLALLLNQIFSE